MAESEEAAAKRNYDAAVADRLRQRAATMLAGDAQAVKILQEARAQITELLAAQPTDFQRWQLTRLRDQIDQILQGTGQRLGAVAGHLVPELWQQGIALVEEPLAAAGVVNAGLATRGVINTRVLQAVAGFAAERLANVTLEAAGKIRQQIGMATMGAQTPFETIQKVQQILGASTPARARAIVLTESARAFALANQASAEDAAKYIPGLQKLWRRSGKMHSRVEHDLIDGQTVLVAERFRVPNPGGGVDMMLHPHDPAAGAAQVVTCGCLSLLHMPGWPVDHPGAKPFAAEELKRNPGKAQLDRQAKAMGLRPEPLMDRRAFTRFFQNEPQSPARFAVAQLSASEQTLFGVDAKDLWLSRQSLDAHKAKHPEVGIDDYLAIPEIIRDGAVWSGNGQRRYVLLHIGDRPYRAALKASANGKEAWFLSLVVSTKQKPPKGAVLLRKPADGSGWRP